MRDIGFSPYKIPASKISDEQDEYILELPNVEPMGTITCGGHTAYFEFLRQHPAFGEDDQMGARYRGEGIYLLDYYKNQEGEDIPFWIIFDGDLSVGLARAILSIISHILKNEEHLASVTYRGIQPGS